MFNTLKVAVQKRFDMMKESDLYRVDVDKDTMWETYLSSFPEGTNPIYKERTEHDCQCCKHFIRSVGNLVAVVDGKMVSIWDIEVDNHYQVVANAMSNLVKSANVSNIFLTDSPHIGTSSNLQRLEDGTILTWDHFYLDIPKKFVLNKDLIPSKLGIVKTRKDVFRRSLSEISLDSIDTVLDLIAQNSLYRGTEFKHAINKFKEHKKAFDKLDDPGKDFYCLSNGYKETESVSHIRNTAIGTLLLDLSDDVDINQAVGSFEAKVAPTNYKRPNSLITKTMIKNAEKKITDLGYIDSLNRRYANIDDITINNIIFANRKTKNILEKNVFSELIDSVSDDIKSFDKVDSVHIDKFISDILPNATNIQLYFENKQENNLMSLIAPENKDSKIMFKWDNNFSWSYNGGVTDSIKQRVKNAGGDVSGDLRCSLSWFNTDDLDLHMIEPGGNYIGFQSKHSFRTDGRLDVDMNVTNCIRNAVENITYPSRSRMIEGIYELYVHNYTKRESVDVGFEVEIEFGGETKTFVYDKPVASSSKIIVAKFKYTHKEGIQFIKALPESNISKEIWGINTLKFHDVNVIMNSPNHWDGNETGNKHYFFILDGCTNPDSSRGFYNEYLSNELNEHRKVFEVLGSKMKTKQSNTQLSGLGFSSTQRNEVYCKVSGKFNRVIKLVF